VDASDIKNFKNQLTKKPSRNEEGFLWIPQLHPTSLTSGSTAVKATLGTEFIDY